MDVHCPNQSCMWFDPKQVSDEHVLECLNQNGEWLTSAFYEPLDGLVWYRKAGHIVRAPNPVGEWCEGLYDGKAASSINSPNQNWKELVDRSRDYLMTDGSNWWFSEDKKIILPGARTKAPPAEILAPLTVEDFYCHA